MLARWAASQSRMREVDLTPAAERALLAHNWPGNVDELTRVVHDAASRSETIDLRHLPAAFSARGGHRLSRLQTLERRDGPCRPCARRARCHRRAGRRHPGDEPRDALPQAALLRHPPCRLTLGAPAASPLGWTLTPEPGDAAPSRDLSGHAGVRSVMETLALHHVTPEVRHLPLAVRTAEGRRRGVGRHPRRDRQQPGLRLDHARRQGGVGAGAGSPAAAGSTPTRSPPWPASRASSRPTRLCAHPHRVRDRRRRPGRPPRAPPHDHRRHPRALTWVLGRRRAQPLGVRDELRRADPDHRLGAMDVA